MNGTTWKYGIGESAGFNENTYKTVEKSTTNDNWRDGSVTANGEIGFIESCDPDEDVFIFNNTKIVTDGADIYDTPVISNILDEQRTGAIERNNFPWIKAVDDYAQSEYGTGWGITWPRKYQPAAQYRIKNNDYTSDNSDLYNRYTNYETGEVGVQWKDAAGNEWNRRSFASRSDDVIVTYIEAPEGQNLDITIGVDNMVEMRNQDRTYYRPTSDNVVTQDSKGYAFGMVGKYAVRNRKGNKNKQETMFAHGGWGTATRIITDGNVDYAADKRNVTVPSSFGGGTINNANDGTTLSDAAAAGDTDCKFIFTPGYSPENLPKGSDARGALAYNSTMDISAARDTLFMARAIMDVVNPADKQQYLEKWADFESKIPDYLYDEETGALKEWATSKLEDNHHHRHVSHAYAAWPGYESQTDDAIREGVIKAMDCRSAAYGGKEASESHGPTHKSLVEARLKNVEGLENVLLYLLTSNYQYSSMMTSHDSNHSSTYCTDSAFGIMGAVNESLLYSNTGIIEILPTLISSADKGSIKGLRARCNTQCDIDWDVNDGKAGVVMTSDADNNVVKVRCGIAWENATINGVRQNIKTDEDNMPYVEVTLNKGASVKVDFSLTSSDRRISVKTDADINKSVSAGDTINLSAVVTFERREADSAEWSIVNAADNTVIAGASVTDGRLVIPDTAKGKTIKIYASFGGVKSNELMLHVAGDAAETFEVCAAKADDDVAVAITNDSREKNLEVIWTAYDSDGGMIDYSEQDITLAANAFGQIVIPARWPAGTSAMLYVWDKNTMVPYTEAISIK